MDYLEIDKTKYTPMMQQYLEIKKDYLDAIVFFRLGDFYEMFFNDALVASKELEIALTGKDAGAEERVPMCGIPYHACNVYIEKLISKGYKIAIAEQITDPKASKGIVERGIVKIITPGTIIEDGSINEDENNYIVSILENKNSFVIAYSDFSTGDNYVTEIAKDVDLLTNEIINLGAKEIVIDQRLNEKYYLKLKKNYQVVVSIENNTALPLNLKELVSNITNNEYILCFSRLINYILKTQKRELSHLKELKIYQSNQYLHIDIHSKKNLELTETLRSGQKSGSLLWLLDKCNTAMGSREIRKWIEKPLVDKEKINERFDFVEAFINNYIAKNNIKESLKTVYDLERIVGRISYGNANAKDLVQLRRSLNEMPKIKEEIKKLGINAAIKLSDEINPLTEIKDLLFNAIVDNPPLTIKEGGIIKEGFNESLDELAFASKNGKEWILKLEAKEKEKTGIKGLKVGYNRVFGYYIEVTKSYLDLVTPELGYERKQTTSNSERFITKELKEKEAMILGASERMIKLEYDLFVEIRDIVAKKIKDLQKLASQISMIDVYLSLADVSEKNNYVRPVINDLREVNVVSGRHPVVESLMDDVFITNDIVINKYNTLLITGPNMSGKSTYMRMMAIISIMAQMGSFVPAKYASLPIFDKIFTRIGASDDLVSGQSTFMVEMMEANNAITNATKNSLILFDEIGRGTATYDGMALAQSIIEYVHEKIGCITFFSTHYHELTALDETLKRLKNVHVTAKEDKDGVVFLHKVIDGASDKSYGINVATLAGLPKALTNRSKQILAELEKNSIKVNIDLFNFDSFEDNDVVTILPNEMEALDELKEIDINSLTPLEALNILNKLVNKVK